MKICPAKFFDINDIMAIEHAAFIPSIQEKQKVFEERMSVFPEGFLILTDNSDELVLKNGKAFVAGYFCSEIWPTVPQNDEFFKLGHSARKVHDKNGPVLYFSSFALSPIYHGKKLAEPFLREWLDSICGAF
ncbi:MAG: hypothetical protein KBT11_01350, partial [Treponema sp.]|nr:hypothetical protein [Candidatus Treponema equifaecale]